MPELNKKVIDTGDKDAELPSELAEIAQEQKIEEPGISPYVISFAKYNEKMGQVPFLTRSNAIKTLEKLKNIGTKVYSDKDFQRNDIKHKSIKDTGEYTKLFNKLRLENDIELKEIILSKKARIFYFNIESERTFYVVAIREDHLETNKVRR